MAPLFVEPADEVSVCNWAAEAGTRSVCARWDGTVEGAYWVHFVRGGIFFADWHSFWRTHDISILRAAGVAASRVAWKGTSVPFNDSRMKAVGSDTPNMYNQENARSNEGGEWKE